MNFAEYLLEDASGSDEAVLDAQGSGNYTELRTLVAQQCAALGALGLSPGSPVAIVGPNGLGWVAAYLAVLASGMVAVPVPSTLTSAEVTARLAWIRASAAFLGDRESRQLSSLSGSVLPLRIDPNRLDAPPDLRFADVAADCDAVYAFTSGTTGQPRAVRHTHANLRANTESILQYLELTSAERVLVVLPFSYVFGASILHTHLRVGATLVIQQNTAFPQSIVERLTSEHCTGFAGVPSTFHVLLRNSTFARRLLPDLRTIQQAGGKLAPVLLRELVAAQPQARVFVMYGQTEATARLSYLPPRDLEAKLGSIGRGIPGVSLRVVDPAGESVAPGEVGEIWARGRNISPGYLDDPAESGRRMPQGELHTGDLATVDSDGYIFIVDRQEDFIKTWGFRVASQDVESAAIHLPDLVAVAAVGVPDDAAGERIELVAVMRSGASLTAEDVIRHCQAVLSKHMVPARVRFVSRLPLNANGKVAKAEVRTFCLRREEDAGQSGAMATGVDVGSQR
ncbi:MAG: AMP-binding protein [Microlunatus sp.]|nr:AMP-binding protein [Microlunatus sp.]